MGANYDLYNYIAANKPNEAKKLLAGRGFDASSVDTVEVLGGGLANLVSEQGESALRDILSIHPDKEAIIQEFSPEPTSVTTKSEGGCKGCKGANNALDSYIEKLKPPVGGSGSSDSMQHGNLLLIGGIIILAVAIIVTKNN